MSNSVFVVTAYWSDYEWQREDLVGVYTTYEKASEIQKLYEEDIERIKNLENPLTEEEQGIDSMDLPVDRWEIWFYWSNKVEGMDNFQEIKIQKIEVDATPILYDTK